MTEHHITITEPVTALANLLAATTGHESGDALVVDLLTKAANARTEDLLIPTEEANQTFEKASL